MTLNDSLIKMGSLTESPMAVTAMDAVLLKLIRTQLIK